MPLQAATDPTHTVYLEQRLQMEIPAVDRVLPFGLKIAELPGIGRLALRNG
jgi:hypothetical protein